MLRLQLVRGAKKNELKKGKNIQSNKHLKFHAKNIPICNYQTHTYLRSL